MKVDAGLLRPGTRVSDGPEERRMLTGRPGSEMSVGDGNQIVFGADDAHRDLGPGPFVEGRYQLGEAQPRSHREARARASRLARSGQSGRTSASRCVRKPSAVWLPRVLILLSASALA